MRAVRGPRLAAPRRGRGRLRDDRGGASVLVAAVLAVAAVLTVTVLAASGWIVERQRIAGPVGTVTLSSRSCAPRAGR